MSSPAQITKADAFEDKNNQNSGKTASDTIRLVQVLAPSTLEEGYTFDAIHDGYVFAVTVPQGGVKAGESFRCRLLLQRMLMSKVSFMPRPFRLPPK